MAVPAEKSVRKGPPLQTVKAGMYAGFAPRQDIGDFLAALRASLPGESFSNAGKTFQKVLRA